MKLNKLRCYYWPMKLLVTENNTWKWTVLKYTTYKLLWRIYHAAITTKNLINLCNVVRLFTCLSHIECDLKTWKSQLKMLPIKLITYEAVWSLFLFPQVMTYYLVLGTDSGRKIKSPIYRLQLEIICDGIQVPYFVPHAEKGSCNGSNYRPK